MTASPDAHDRFWRHVMGKAYRAIPQGADLTPLEIEGLEVERIMAHWDRNDDTWHAAVGELRDDGATVAVPLTLERLDAYCLDYERTGKTTPYSMAPA